MTGIEKQRATGMVLRDTKVMFMQQLNGPDLHHVIV